MEQIDKANRIIIRCDHCRDFNGMDDEVYHCMRKGGYVSAFFQKHGREAAVTHHNHNGEDVGGALTRFLNEILINNITVGSGLRILGAPPGLSQPKSGAREGRGLSLPRAGFVARETRPTRSGRGAIRTSAATPQASQG
jgi:hypothetical protein